MEKGIYKVQVKLVDGVTKEFRTDEVNEHIILKRFKEKYGEIEITRTLINTSLDIIQ